MDKNNVWHLILLFLMLEDENVVELMSSNTFENDFNKLIQKYKTMDSDDFKEKSINILIHKKDLLQELNTAYLKVKER